MDFFGQVHALPGEICAAVCAHGCSSDKKPLVLCFFPVLPCMCRCVFRLRNVTIPCPSDAVTSTIYTFCDEVMCYYWRCFHSVWHSCTFVCSTPLVLHCTTMSLVSLSQDAAIYRAGKIQRSISPQTMAKTAVELAPIISK